MATDNFQNNLIGTSKAPFLGYLSAEDPTRVSPQMMVRGSQNAILYNNGNIGPRPGLKRYDPADNTQDPVVSSFDWNNLDGSTLLLRTLESGPLQFYQPSVQTWRTLRDFGANTDLSYAKWWSSSDVKELLVMCDGTSNLYAWSGANTPGVGAVNTGNTLQINGSSGVVDGFSFLESASEGFVTSAYNRQDGSDLRAAWVLDANPTGSSVFIGFDVSATVPFPAGEVWVQFVDVLTSPIASNFAQVLIGSSKESTVTNLLALFNNPGADTATQKGFTDSDVVNSIVPYFSYEIVPSLESGSSDTWTEQGFVNDGSIIVDGVEYTYNLVAGRWLTDISGTPPEDTFGYAGIIVTDMIPQIGEYLIDFILCLKNQIIGCSNTSRIVYISSNQDETSSTGYNDWVQVGDVVPGDPDFVVIDEFPVGGTTRGESAYIGAGNSSWYELTPNTSVPAFVGTVFTETRKFAGAGLTAPLGKNFVGTLGEDIIFVDQQNQLRTLGFYRNIDTQKTPSLSLAVRQELEQEDFTGGCLRSVGEYTYLVAPLSGKTYLYEIRDDVDEVGNISSQRHWHPRQTWNISRIAVVNGLTHGYSAETPQLYQLWDTEQWYDDTSEEDVFAPYVTRMRLGYQQIGERDNYGEFDKVYYEGYIQPGSDLTSNVYYDYQGATKIVQVVLGTASVTPDLFGRDGVNLIGESLIGAELIGGGLSDENYPNAMPKFRAIADVQIGQVFEYQIELVSVMAGSRWEILCVGANATKAPQSPTFIKTGSTVLSN